MIEIEKTFFLTDKEEKRLLEGAEFMGEKVMKDVYYDNNNFDVMTKDRWLRERNGKFELKIPAVKQKSVGKRDLDQYEEITDEEKIRKILGVKNTGSLRENLESGGFSPVATIITTRRTYEKDNFTIDLDSVDFDTNYRVAEIELMVEKEDEIEGASNRIIAFAKTMGLKLDPTHGKLVEYLRRNHQKIYQTLIEAGVVWH